MPSCAAFYRPAGFNEMRRSNAIDAETTKDARLRLSTQDFVGFYCLERTKSSVSGWRAPSRICKTPVELARGSKIIVGPNRDSLPLFVPVEGVNEPSSVRTFPSYV